MTIEGPSRLYLEYFDGGLALYSGGDLQLDSRDEAIYHESLVHPLMSAIGADRRSVRLLICGGGDGMALREALRWTGVDSVNLVDYDSDMLDLALGELSELNRNALKDRRVHAHCVDALEYVRDSPARFDGIICDLTVPSQASEAELHSREWYEALSKLCSDGGALAINACSPEISQAAYWCIETTLRIAGWWTTPYHVFLPSFAEHGYGDWGYFLARRQASSPGPPRLPPDPRWLTRDRFRAMRRFPRRQLALRGHVGPTTKANSAFWWYLLNGAPAPLAVGASNTAPSTPRVGRPIRRARSLTLVGASRITPRVAHDVLDRLEDRIPVHHRYHTRAMLGEVWSNPWPYLERLDPRRLLDALLDIAGELPAAVARELRHAASLLRESVTSADALAKLGERALAALVVAVIVANTLFPDSAFAKGAPGSSHFSISHSSGFVASGPTTEPATLQGGGFGRVTSRDGTADAFGVYYPRTYYPTTSWSSRSYYGYGGGGGIGNGNGGGSALVTATPRAGAPQPPPRNGSVYYLTDDSQLLDNGDVVVTLGSRYYLQVAPDALVMADRTTGAVLTRLYPEPDLVSKLHQELGSQSAWLQRDIAQRQSWIAWVGWLKMLPVISSDLQEVENIKLTVSILHASGDRLAAIKPTPPNVALTESHAQLFAGADLLNDGIIALHLADGGRLYAAGATAYRSAADARSHANPVSADQYPAPLASALAQVLTDYQADVPAQIKSIDQDLATTRSDQAALTQQQQYLTSVFESVGRDRSHQVTYGSDDMPVGAALDQISAGLAQDAAEITRLTTARAALVASTAPATAARGLFLARRASLG